MRSPLALLALFLPDMTLIVLLHCRSAKPKKNKLSLFPKPKEKSHGPFGAPLKKHKSAKASKSQKAKEGKLSADTDGVMRRSSRPIFGAPLVDAVQRSEGGDSVPLPAVVRLCFDYIGEHGMRCSLEEVLERAL